MKLRGRDWSRDHGEMLLLVVSPGLLSYVPYITQDHLTGDDTINRGLNPPTLISNLKMSHRPI